MSTYLRYVEGGDLNCRGCDDFIFYGPRVPIHVVCTPGVLVLCKYMYLHV